MIKRKDMLKLASKNDHEKLKEFYKKAYGKTHILNDSTHTEWQFQKNPFNTIDGFSLVEASEVSIYPQYDDAGGVDSERTFVKQIVQKFCDDGSSDDLFNEEEVEQATAA